jgi:hypothetical protein
MANEKEEESECIFPFIEEEFISVFGQYANEPNNNNNNDIVSVERYFDDKHQQSTCKI